jgi:NAD(P)-dependent dehydrogenase (short-subunit alcohol dehydrogenase family)
VVTTRFADHVALVTGGGSGIGRHTARTLAGEGATVVVAGRNKDTLCETVRQIEMEGGSASAVVADVTNEADVECLIAATVARHGGLHVAVNCAGTLRAPAPVAALDRETWHAVLETNLTGVWLSMKHEIGHMRVHGGGTIVNVASNIGAHMRVPTLGAYAAAKAGVSALTRTAAREYIADGVRINAVSPGPIDTPMSLRPGETSVERAARLSSTLPIARVGALDEVVATILWLASREAGFVVGHDLVLDGGATA